jgi:hypothetical protein
LFNNNPKGQNDYDDNKRRQQKKTTTLLISPFSSEIIHSKLYSMV